MRRLLPLTITRPVTDEEIARLKTRCWARAMEVQTEYVREYPLGNVACHVIGYVSRDEPRPFGPIHPLEPIWPRVKGREGVEQSLDQQLAERWGF